jgi:hypothetical protein
VCRFDGIAQLLGIKICRVHTGIEGAAAQIQRVGSPFNGSVKR